MEGDKTLEVELTGGGYRNSQVYSFNYSFNSYMLIKCPLYLRIILRYINGC